MTEQEWLACTNLWRLMDQTGYLRGEASERKLRLLAVACCRRLWNLLPDERSRRAVEVAELDADGLAERGAVVAAWRSAAGPARVRRRYAGRGTPQAMARDSALVSSVRAVNSILGRCDHLQAQVALVRDIFGNPFRPVYIDPAWLRWHDSTLVHMVQAIYDERRFADLPILADALEEAGCTDPDILGHCRQPGAHVRGCWVVDRILAKE
jgi:hypothetical protein